MIRPVKPDDSAAVAAIYNHYVTTTDISFETLPLTDEAMRGRILSLARECPYFVYEEDGAVLGYCYAHPWKERAAYSRTFETTVYVDPHVCGRGIGPELMLHLIGACRIAGVHALIACITAGNIPSERMHLSLGFVKVSHFREVGLKHGHWLDVADYELIL